MKLISFLIPLSTNPTAFFFLTSAQYRHIGHNERKMRALFQNDFCLLHTLEPDPANQKHPEHEPAIAAGPFCGFYLPSQIWFLRPDFFLPGRRRRQRVLSSRDFPVPLCKVGNPRRVPISRGDKVSGSIFPHFVLPLKGSSLPLLLLLFHQSVRGFHSFLFTLPDYRSGFFRNRRRHRLAGNLRHRTKFRRANFKARPALCAFLLVNYTDPVLATCNRLGRALLKTNHTGLALARVDMVRDQLFAGKSRASLLLDVCLILISKVF